MHSVIRWRGVCRDTEVQTELTDRLRPFAETSRTMFLSVKEDCPEQFESSGSELIREYQGPIQGRILIQATLVTLEQSHDIIGVSSRTVCKPGQRPSRSSCLIRAESNHQWSVWREVPLPAIELHGIHFRVYSW